MQVNGVCIDDTSTQAYVLVGTRLLITAESHDLALAAARNLTGFASQVASCKCEAGIEDYTPVSPDGRPGLTVLFFAPTAEELQNELETRIRQSVMPCPTTACYNALSSETTITIGRRLRLLGDGWQRSYDAEAARYWRIPVMDGEFVIEETFGCREGICGAHFVILGEDEGRTLTAAEHAVRAIREVPGVALPYPAGIARAGMKPGSRYKSMAVSTITSFCPTLRGSVASSLPPTANSALQIAIDGLSMEAVTKALQAGIVTACEHPVVGITAIDRGEDHGQIQIPLHRVVDATLSSTAAKEGRA